MIKTITENNFRTAFANIGRGEQFSYDGLTALFNYLEAYEESTGEQIELDVIALCCDYVEYENFEALQADYPDYESMEDLEDYTTVIRVKDDSFIIQAF